MTLRLSDAEIAELCDPLVQAAAQERYLRGLFPNLPIRKRSNGKLLILRADFEAQGSVTQPRSVTQSPDIASFMRRIGKRAA